MIEKGKVLVVDDDENIRKVYSRSLTHKGYDCVSAVDGKTGLERLTEDEFAVALIDLRMPGVSGEELLSVLCEKYPQTPAIIVTGSNDIRTAVRCMKLGAFDFLLKPLEEDQMIAVVERAVEHRELRHEFRTFRDRVLADELERPEAFAQIVTKSPLLRTVFQYVETIAKTTRPVLVTGETGVGKELIAKAIHSLSELDGPLVTVNAAGLDDNAFTDTLFGHLKGAFTGADTARSGLIESAAGGTLLLDEIGDLKPESQVKLLRLFQELEYYPLGSDVPKTARARFVLTTNRDLEALCYSGHFRADLYYRLQTHHVHIPPLRERSNDIPLLLDFFLERTSDALGKKKPTIPKELLAWLANYPFPGNVRELEAVVFDAVNAHKSRMLSMDVFKASLPITNGSREENAKFPDPQEGSIFCSMAQLPSLKEATQALVREAMKRTDNNQSAAARLLGIGQSALSRRLKRSGD